MDRAVITTGRYNDKLPMIHLSERLVATGHVTPAINFCAVTSAQLQRTGKLSRHPFSFISVSLVISKHVFLCSYCDLLNAISNHMSKLFYTIDSRDKHSSSSTMTSQVL